MRFLALGDSYTIGEGVAPADTWPAQLAARLRAEGYPLEDPVIIATTGWTTGELAEAIERLRPPGTFELVSLLIGVNNQYRGLSLDEYRAGFAGLLDQAIAFAGANPRRVLVISIPDWGATPFAEGRDRAAVAAAIDQFNLANAAAAHERGTHYVDVTAVSRRVASDPARMAGDGLHPSGQQYRLWTELMMPAAREALNSPSLTAGFA